MLTMLFGIARMIVLFFVRRRMHISDSDIDDDNATDYRNVILICGGGGGGWQRGGVRALQLMLIGRYKWEDTFDNLYYCEWAHEPPRTWTAYLRHLSSSRIYAHKRNYIHKIIASSPGMP